MRELAISALALSCVVLAPQAVAKASECDGEDDSAAQIVSKKDNKVSRKGDKRAEAVTKKRRVSRPILM